MKIKSLKLPFTKKSALLVCFFATMFLFASFTKEDRYKVREWKKDLMSRLTDQKDVAPTFSNLNLDEIFSQVYPKKNILDKQSSGSSADNLNFNSGLDIKQNSEEKISDVINSYSANEKEGMVGIFSEEEEDRVSDNFFTIDIPAFNQQNTNAYLEYDLFGLASHQSVPRSINRNLAIGGEIIVPQAVWSHQREELGSDYIKSGINTILFTSPSTGVKYKIKNLKIIFEKNKNILKNLIVNSALSGDQLYVKGFNNLSTVLNINGNNVDIKNGEYEKVIHLSEKDKLTGNFSVTTNGVTQLYEIPEDKKSFKVLNNNYFNSQEITVSDDKEFDIQYENLNLKIEKGTSESAYLQVLKLREKDIPSTSGGLKNVTLNKTAYRFSVISGKLNKKVKITIPYDEKRLGSISPNEIKVFSFDYKRKQWAVAGATVVDQKNKMVTFEADGDGDYINGVISVPESPQINASNPTGISDLKAINPSIARNFINAPSANQKGSANVSYPIVIPAGRKGMQPSISVGYDSNRANGWLGEGWDINGLSSISIDTRWGSPRFDPTDETELYSMDGNDARI